MRNLLEFPISREEVLEVLDRAIKENEQFIGAIDGFVLERIKTHLENNHLAMIKVLTELDVRYEDTRKTYEKRK